MQSSSSSDRIQMIAYIEARLAKLSARREELLTLAPGQSRIDRLRSIDRKINNLLDRFNDLRRLDAVGSASADVLADPGTDRHGDSSLP